MKLLDFLSKDILEQIYFSVEGHRPAASPNFY